MEALPIFVSFIRVSTQSSLYSLKYKQIGLHRQGFEMFGLNHHLRDVKSARLKKVIKASNVALAYQENHHLCEIFAHGLAKVRGALPVQIQTNLTLRKMLSILFTIRRRTIPPLSCTPSVSIISHFVFLDIQFQLCIQIYYVWAHSKIYVFRKPKD